MCVYLAPRWRRRLFVLALTVVQLLLRADARTLRKLNIRHKTEHTDSGLTPVGENTDSELTSVSKNTDSEFTSVDKNTGSGLTSVGDTNVGVVTTNSTQGLTTVTDKAWSSDSNKDDSRRSTDKSVSFNNLVKVKTTPSTNLNHLELSGSVSVDCDVMNPCATKGKTNTGDPKQGNDDIDASFDKGANNAGANISSDTKSANDETTIQTGITNEAATPEPVPPTTLHSAPITHAPPPPPPPPLVLGPSKYMTQGWSSSSSSAPSVAGKNPDSTDSAEVLESEAKSAFSTTASRSLDQTLVVVIIGVVGAIGMLVMLVSRRVLKETQDDDLDLVDSRVF